MAYLGVSGSRLCEVTLSAGVVVSSEGSTGGRVCSSLTFVVVGGILFLAACWNEGLNFLLVVG